MTAASGVSMEQAHRVSRVSIRKAAEDAIEGHWRKLRSYRRCKSQVLIGVKFLENLGRHYLDEVTEQDLVQFREWSFSTGLSAASVNCRLSCLSVLGIKVKYARLPKIRKWYLSQAEERQLYALGLEPLLLHFVRWTIATGLRIEESLALHWADVDLEAGTVRVPGTKTDLAEATLPLSDEAKRVLDEWWQHQPRNTAQRVPVFPIAYSCLRRQWQDARVKLGLQDVKTATLKSLRRSFARRAHVKGMPIDILRQYLRHGSLKTTQGYLYLVGGYNPDEMRRWL